MYTFETQKSKCNIKLTEKFNEIKTEKNYVSLCMPGILKTSREDWTLNFSKYLRDICKKKYYYLNISSKNKTKNYKHYFVIVLQKV